MKPRGWNRDGRPVETYDDVDEPDLPPRACSTPGCKGTTRDIGLYPKCRLCRPTNPWRLK